MATRKTRTGRTSVPRRSASQRKVARPWTREEIAFMRKYYRKFETTWVARQLGRTVYSVRYKAVDLNIKKANPSVWKGNKGTNNAFRPATPKRATSRKSSKSSRTQKSRRTTSKRRWAASTTRKTTARKATSRKSNARKANSRKSTARKAQPRRRNRSRK